MNSIRDIIVSGADDRPVLLDLHYPPQQEEGPFPLIVFAHGFKGFKDWGIWELVARDLTQAGFAFLKFNFSHNGTTPESPADFGDLEAFGRNTYSKEQADLEAVLDWAEQARAAPGLQLDLDRIALIGHSRGGPIVLLQGLHDKRVKAVVTWASVATLDYAWQDEEQVQTWREQGVMHIPNARTGQQMPVYYSIYQDFQDRREELDVVKALQENRVPFLIVHGTADPAVPDEHARRLHSWAPWSQLELIEGADHVFGGRHPWTSENLPKKAKKLVALSQKFLENALREP